jgi:hypothetical protein
MEDRMPWGNEPISIARPFSVADALGILGAALAGIAIITFTCNVVGIDPFLGWSSIG